MNTVTKRGCWTKDMLPMGIPYLKGKTLDVGAGSAKYREFYESHVGEYLTADMIEQPGIDYVEDAHNMSFQDGTFDTVVSNQMLEHVKQPWKVIEEMMRVLKPGGHALVTVPFMAGEHSDPDDYYRFSAHGIRYLFENANAEIVVVQRYGGLGSIVGSLCKFGFAHPYRNPSKWRVRIGGFFQKLMKKLDVLSPASDVLYGGTFLVAKKRS